MDSLAIVLCIVGVLCHGASAGLCQVSRVFAVCNMEATQGNSISGVVEFSEVIVNADCELKGDLEIRVALTGLSSTDSVLTHGFHVHEFGDLSNSCYNTGGHYNPFNTAHGGLYSSIRHIGDLGNVQEDGFGNINTNIVDKVSSLVGYNSIIDRAIVIHAGEDDLGQGGNRASTINGNAGARLGCCVIQRAKGPNFQAVTQQ